MIKSVIEVEGVQYQNLELVLHKCISEDIKFVFKFNDSLRFISGVHFGDCGVALRLASLCNVTVT